MKLSKEEFIKLINDYEENNSLVNNLNELIPDFWQWSVVDFGWRMFEKIIDVCFTEEGKEWISAYLYDGCREYWVSEDNVTTSKPEHYTINDAEELWNLVKDYRV